MKPLTVDSMDIDVGTSEVKMSACPVDTMTPPPVLAKNSTLSKPTSKHFTHVAKAKVVRIMISSAVLEIT